jgi:hypothetical protein
VALGKIVSPVRVIFQSCQIPVVAPMPEGREMPGGSVYVGVVLFVYGGIDAGTCPVEDTPVPSGGDGEVVLCSADVVVVLPVAIDCGRLLDVVGELSIDARGDVKLLLTLDEDEFPIWEETDVELACEIGVLPPWEDAGGELPFKVDELLPWDVDKIELASEVIELPPCEGIADDKALPLDSKVDEPVLCEDAGVELLIAWEADGLPTWEVPVEEEGPPLDPDTDEPALCDGVDDTSSDDAVSGGTRTPVVLLPTTTVIVITPVWLEPLSLAAELGGPPLAEEVWLCQIGIVAVIVNSCGEGVTGNGVIGDGVYSTVIVSIVLSDSEG